jgi:cytidine deaminase
MQTPPTDMLLKANDVLKHAYCPYSEFQVAACVKTHDGNLYAAVNIENACYCLGTCAETNAIARMIAEGETTISAVLVLTPTATPTSPCGACRQRIAEFAAPDTPIYLSTLEHGHASHTLKELLPHSFGAQNLESL